MDFVYAIIAFVCVAILMCFCYTCIKVQNKRTFQSTTTIPEANRPLPACPVGPQSYAGAAPIPSQTQRNTTMYQYQQQNNPPFAPGYQQNNLPYPPSANLQGYTAEQPPPYQYDPPPPYMNNAGFEPVYSIALPHQPAINR